MLGRSVLLVLVVISVVVYRVQGQRTRPGSYNVTRCPQDCECSGQVGYRYMDFWSMDGFHIHNRVYIANCKSDPLSGLTTIIQADHTIDDVQIVNSLGHTDVNKVFNVISKLRSLRVLRLPRNNLTELPEDIGYLSRLERLDVSDNKLTSIPSAIGRLWSLKYLVVSRNNLSTLPTASWRLSSLRWLDVSYNRLMGVDLGRILIAPHIQIDLSHNQIATLGSAPRGEPDFSHVDLSNNKLKSLDAWFFRLGVPYTAISWRTDRARVLNVSMNSISSFTNRNGYTALPNTWQLPQSQQIMWKVVLTHNEVRYLHVISQGLNITDGETIHLLISDKLTLEYNPFNCDCKDYVIYQRLRKQVLPPSLRCGSPRHLRGHRVIDLRQDQFVCEITEGCPEGCFCNQTPYNQSLNTYCTEDKVKHHLPTQLSFLPHSYGYKLNSDDGFLKNLTYVPYLSDTVSVSFRNNQISYISPDFFNTSNFKLVDLRNNRLTSVDSWPLRMVVEQIEAQIYLDGNEISVYTNDAGYNPQEPYRRFHHKDLWDIFISLKDTGLTHFSALTEHWNLTVMILQDLLEVEVVEVTNNPLFCDCEDFEIYQLIHYKHNITCYNPVELRGKEITEIPPDNFQCVLEEDCPVGCRCTDITNQGVLRVDCYNYTDTELPLTLPTPKKPNPEFLYILNFAGGFLTTLGERQYLHMVKDASFSHNNISEIEHGFFKIMKNYDVLRLDHNQIETLPAYIVNRPYILMYLAYNEWNCSCENEYSILWIHANRKEIGDYVNITCHEPDMFENKDFGAIGELLCAEFIDAWYATNIPLIILAVILALILVWFYVVKVRGVRLFSLCIHDPFRGGGDMSREFDVFVSYVPEDATYVEGYLIPKLEEMGFKIFQYRLHFRKKDALIWNVHRAIMKSDRTLTFLSKAYLDNPDSMHEFYSALTMHIEEGGNKLVTIKDTEVEISMMDIGVQSYFEHHEFIELESPRFWDDLLFVLQIDKIDAPENGNDNTKNSNDNEMVAILAEDSAI